MFKLLSNNLKSQTQRANSARKFYLSSYKCQMSKTGAANSSQGKLNERLSFLKSEEEMRKYFNIIDWEKRECENLVQSKFREEKEEYSKSRQDYQKFNREELFKIVSDFKQELNKTSKVDHTISASVKNNFEIVNEFSLDNIDFLKDKPKNYLLVSGFENVDDIKTVLNLLREQGEVIQHNIIYNLMGKASLIEVFFYSDEEAARAKFNLHNISFKQGHILRLFNYSDAHRENIHDRTVVISGLDSTLKQNQVLEFVSTQGNVLKLQMPFSTSSKSKPSSIDAFNTCEQYFQVLERNLDNSQGNEKVLMKHKLQFYSVQINKLINDFKEKVIDATKQDYNLQDYFSHINNLLVEIKFFMKKFFPNESINELIIPELRSLRQNMPSEKVTSLEYANSNYKEKSQEAFNKIVNNIEKFLSKYEDKMNRLTKPLTADEIPIDLLEVEANNKKNATSADPERLDKNLIFEAADKTEETEIKSEFSKINFYSTFLPLEEQIAKLNFLRSLTEEEKVILKDKYDLNLSVNTPKFLDYFINFSQAVGVKVIDKYIQLSELYMSMTPLEKMYHGKKLAKSLKNKKLKPNRDEEVLRDNLMDFLGIRKQRKIKDIYHLNSMRIKFDKDQHTRFLDIESDVVLSDLYNMLNKGKLPNIGLAGVFRIMRKSNMITQKINYIQALVPMNLAKKRVYIEKIRARMVKYNEVLLEFIKNYQLLEPDNELRHKYDPEVRKLSELVFGKVDPLTEVNLELLNDESEEKKGFDLPDKNRLDHGKGQEEGEKGGKSRKDKAKHFNKTEYTYSGNPLQENQIVNRLDFIKSIRDKIINSILRVSNLGHYTSKKYEKINSLVHNKLNDYVNTVFKDNPKLQAHYLEKVTNKLNSLKYTNLQFDEKQYKLEEIVEDLVQKEIDYKKKVDFAKRYIDNLEELTGEKISKGNLIKALSVYESMFQIHEKYNDYRYLKSQDRSYQGSPVYVFFNCVKHIFQAELEKVNKVKELKLNEINKDANLTLDELFNKRKELIEDYTNKIVSYKEASEIKEKTLEELENYKLKKLSKSEEDLLLDEDDTNYSLVQSEIRKKDFEIKQNRMKHGVEHEEEYTDVSSLISNLNKLQNKSDDVAVTSTYEKLIRNLQAQKPHNKGFAFVTFSTSDEAKKFYLMSQAGFKIGKKKVEVQPKFDLTLENFDEEFMLRRAKADGNLLNKRDELLQAESKLRAFEESFYENLENNEKLNEFKAVREAFKDLYSDPFKKHDRNNPLTPEEEEEVKYRAKMAHADEDESAWLFEDDNLEKMRVSRDKRITKKYVEGQLLKKGIVTEDIIKMQQNNQTKTDPKYDIVKPFTDSFFNESNDFDVMNRNSSLKHGRKFTPLSTTEFIESILEKDYLEQTVPAFPKDTRESAVYSEIKELRERFPREKFVGDANRTENLINEVNSKFVRLLKYEDSANPEENAKEALLENLTNVTPLGKQLQMIINERNDKVQDEETRQMITLQNFYETKLQKYFTRNTLVKNIPEKSIDDAAFSQIMFKNNPNRDLYRVKYEHPGPRPPIREGFEPEVKKFEPGDTSFEAFLHRRRNYLEEKPGEKPAESKEAEEKKTQFDPNDLSRDEIRRAKEESVSDVFMSIKQKYEKHLGVIDKVKSKGNVSYASKESLYDYMARREGEHKNQIYSKKSEADSLIKKEKLKNKFVEELEKNFSEELETLPSFKEYFLSLKYNNSINTGGNNSSNRSDFNFSETFQFDTSREQYALLKSDKISPESFKKTFIDPQKQREERLKKWINEQDQEYLQNLSFSKMGIDPNDKEAMELLKANNPHFFSEEEARKYLEEKSQMEENLKDVEDLEDKSETEYYFNPDSGETLEEHLAGLAKTKYSKVTLRKDEEGRMIIRREFKNNYKYDLDELMNFDIVKEREKMMKKLENFDFKAELGGNVDFFLKFAQLVNSNETALQSYLSTPVEEFEKKISTLIRKIEEYFRVSYNMDNFYFDDFKRMVDNLLTLNPKSLTNFVNSVSRLIRLIRQSSSEDHSEEISDELKAIADFSKDVFNEREVRIFVELMKNVLTGLGDKNIRDLDNLSKFIFIQNVLLKDIMSNLSAYLNNEEVIYLFSMLKLLPNKISFSYNFNDEQEMKKRLRVILWNNYKTHMLNSFNIVLKRENEIKSHPALEAALEQKSILAKSAEVNPNSISDKNLEREIEEYSNKLKEFYIELGKANTSDFDISSIVSDEELFIEEITEQIQTRLKRLKTHKKLSKEDLVKRRYNEENLYKKQLEYVYKVGKRFEAMAYREDVEQNQEMKNEVTEALRTNAIRKKRLLKEGRPEIDLEYPRLI